MGKHTILESRVVGLECELSGCGPAAVPARAPQCKEGAAGLAVCSWPKLPSSKFEHQAHSQFKHARASDIPAAIMSRASKLTLAATSLGAVGIVIFVHYSQRAEKTVKDHHPRR